MTQTQKFPSKSAEVRDVANDGSRFWITEAVGNRSYGIDTVGIVDENEGGVVAYTHRDNAEAFLTVLRHYTNEV
jgi:hypothetical protein